MSEQRTIRIHLNGADRDVEADHTVRTLIQSLDLHPALIVVELNREILSRDLYEKAPVRDGDTIELVHFVGGG